MAKYICQIQAPVDLAPVGYQQHGEAFFRVSRRKKSFDEAVAACGQFGGGRLAQPQTKELNDYVKGKIGESSLDGGAWVGIKLEATEESWSFLDGTPGDTSYSNWAPGEPSGKGCVTMASDGGWQIENCEEEAHYVCQIGDEENCGEQLEATVYCGGSRGGSSGRISSPGYEENVNYPNNLQCQWDITVPGEDDVIEFTLEEFELEENDRLEIHDVCVHGYRRANLNGSSSVYSSPIFTSTNRATLSFISDDSYSARGFKLAYRAVPPPQSRSVRSLEEVQDMQGVDRRKRALPVCNS
ncbi:CUB and sushi domain-containing protein 1-like isoform X2 [Branchiostoma floridae]|uniref:CUB and sushi domain-containing protein 1-like isoform X2 n=1 Tax=Branchiostoma floridae TaxID=7739 RepID=A0A9J7N7T2_BRAFL|nr:CUB and sushi domain-containing protein 1-like isoform X2 [Branchiostoma floridae]